MKKMVKKAAIATLVMGTSMVSMVGISFATTTITPPPSTTISGATWYQVSTAGELEYIDQNQSTYLSANIELMNNVDLTGYSWVPLGSRTYDASTHSLLAFSGTFNGKGYGLSNVNVNEPSASNVGIFGASTGTIENLHVSGSVSGSNNVGGLVGFQDGGIIVDSFATNSVSGSDSVGGLVGSQNSSSITDSYATGSVSGSDNDTGGLVGSQNGGSLTDSYATGSVSGYLDVGSLVGAQGGSITDSYATGKVSGTGFLGGFLGSQIDSSITDSYFDPQSTDQSSGVGFSQTATGTPTPITGTQWNTPATFTGWDFTNTWGIDPLLNHGYPYLLALKSSYYAQPLDISPTVQAGTTMGSSMVTSTPNTSGDTLEYAISAGPLSPPPLNSTPPNGLQTSGVLSPVKVGDYVGVYELNAQNQVVAFSQIGPLRGRHRQRSRTDHHHASVESDSDSRSACIPNGIRECERRGDAELPVVQQHEQQQFGRDGHPECDECHLYSLHLDRGNDVLLRGSHQHESECERANHRDLYQSCGARDGEP